MKILEYVDFSPPRNKAQYARIRAAIERDDFHAADVKKLSNLTQGKFYRAKLDYADRLLFSIVRFNGEALLGLTGLAPMAEPVIPRAGRR